MKKNRIYIVLYFLTIYFPMFSQFGTAPSCTENVNKNFPGNFIGKENLINSSFMIFWNSGSACTGTLINREVPYGQLGYYFITSRHCIVSSPANPNSPLDINLNVDQRLIFNYQSKDANNSGTEVPNRGSSNSQSTSLSSTGYEYIHDTKIRLVERYFWGDFALFEILTPIPPHFGVAFAGWNVRPIVFNTNCINNGGQYQFSNFSHPSRDIKKIAGACVAVDKTTPVATGCYTIMTIVNTLVNWFLQIFNVTYNFTTICQYVDNPWTVIPGWSVGGTTNGSSGSGLFATAGAPFISFQENKYVGTLSGGLFSCGTPTTFTKFYHNYPKTAVYSTLNPSNNWVAQTFGIGGRFTNCYSNLNNLSGYYFPKNHIRSNNAYQLSTIGSISNDPSKPWKFINGSDYKMIAQNAISLSGSNSVTVEAGATVEFKIASCTGGDFSSFKTITDNEDPYEKEKRETTEALINSLKAIKVPKNKVFNEKDYMAKYHPNPISTINVAPNPSDGIFNVSTTLKGLKKVSIKNTFAQKLMQFEVSESSFKVDLSAYPAGIYNLSIFNGEENLFLKLIKE